MTRAEAIRNFLACRKKPASLGEILTGLEQLRQAEDLEREAFTRHVSAQLANMTKFRKLVRTGQPYGYRYALAADGQRDRRAKPPSPRKAERKRRKADRPAPRPAAPTTAAKPAKAPCKAGPLARMDLTATPSTARVRPSLRDQLAADVAAFLAAGGAIQRLAAGESSQPLLHTRREIEARPGRLAKHRIHDEEADDLDLDVAA